MTPDSAYSDGSACHRAGKPARSATRRDATLASSMAASNGGDPAVGPRMVTDQHRWIVRHGGVLLVRGALVLRQ
jgi:hypothetical protein